MKLPPAVVGAVLLVGALVLLRPGPPAPEGTGPDVEPPPPPPPPPRGDGEETQARQAEIEAGERAGLDLQRSGKLEAELDFDTRERSRFQVIHGSPVGGIRHDARIHVLHATEAVIRAVKDYFWQSLQWSGAGFHYKVNGQDALVLIENPEGVFHAPQLLPTEYALKRNWVQAYWVSESYVVRAGGRRPDTISRMHRPTDELVRRTSRGGMSLRGAGNVTQVYEHFPTWRIYDGEHLMRPHEILSRSIAVPLEQHGPWSLICASEQCVKRTFGHNGGASPVLSQFVSPLPYLWDPGHNVVDSNPAVWEERLLEVGKRPSTEVGRITLARIHPRTKEPWRVFSFLRTREVPENPKWSFGWWSPWYPQHREDPTRTPLVLPELFEPHLGGGSQLSEAFTRWVLPPSVRWKGAPGLGQTGDVPRGQWVGAIPMGLPQDCVRVGDLIRCEVGRPPDSRSPCGTITPLIDQWTIGYDDRTCPDPETVVFHSGISRAALGSLVMT